MVSAPTALAVGALTILRLIDEKSQSKCGNQHNIEVRYVDGNKEKDKRNNENNDTNNLRETTDGCVNMIHFFPL